MDNRKVARLVPLWSGRSVEECHTQRQKSIRLVEVHDRYPGSHSLYLQPTSVVPFPPLPQPTLHKLNLLSMHLAYPLWFLGWIQQAVLNEERLAPLSQRG